MEPGIHSSSTAAAASKELHLEPETEYRFELDPGTTLAIKLIKGTAEIFGAELAEGKTYLFAEECKAAIYTWHGCTIQVVGHPSTDYVSDETVMTAYLNIHIALEQRRIRALKLHRNSPTLGESRNDSGEIGYSDPPRVLVLGPENSGKTTFCKILTNYIVRAGQGWTPMLVNLDPSEGGWAVPGSISAAAIFSPLPTSTASQPLGSAATSAPTSLSSSTLLPLSYWFGHNDVKRNPLLMDRLVRNLGENIKERHERDNNGRISGVIVDTPSLYASSGPGSAELRYNLVKACIDAFNINVILVLSHEKLNIEMKRHFGTRVQVVKIPKSGGTVDLDHAYRERVQRAQIQSYFYGQRFEAPGASAAPSEGSTARSGPGASHAAAVTASLTLGGEDLVDSTLSPLSTVINMDDLTIYRIGGESIAPSSALPVGATRIVSELQPILINTSPSFLGGSNAAPGSVSRLLNAVLAVIAERNPDENERYDEEVLDLEVTGYIAVTNVDITNRRLTILQPSPGPLTGRIALAGSIEWQER